MPLTEQQKKERRKESNKKYYQQNKEKIKEKDKKYNEKNKQKIKEQKKEYYEENKERIKEKIKEYSQTENGKKSIRISSWKYIGVISDDYDALYEKYINTNECEICNISIMCGKGLIGKKHLDHCHVTGQFRHILCGDCNVRVMKNK